MTMHYVDKLMKQYKNGQIDAAELHKKLRGCDDFTFWKIYRQYGIAVGADRLIFRGEN